MSTYSSFNLSYAPGVQSLVPILYTAWADHILAPTEIKTLRRLAEEAPFLTAEDKEALLQWGQPTRPPSPHLFRYWEVELQRAAEQLPPETEQSLAELGLYMAQQASDNPKEWQAPDILQYLKEIEAALGQVSLDTHRFIFNLPEPEPEGQAPGTPKAEDLQAVLDGKFAGLRKRMRHLLSDPVFRYQHHSDKTAHRQQVLQWLGMLAEQGLGGHSYPFAQGGQNDMGSYATIFEMLGYHDLSLAIKFGVQFGLFGGSILQLGTARHHKKYLEAIGKGELLGCFAMTETGHGSNVRGLETTITYDSGERVFVVHSPKEESGKEYIGNALHGELATVFGQLIVNGESHGIHAILVPLRKDGQLLPGIRVEDCGPKLGLNGVDNGRIWFDAVRVPRTNLLNRFGEVTKEGQYTSPIESPSRRFFTMLGTLVGGRVCVPRAGLSATKSGLAIAIRYALKRRQFAPRHNEPETLLLDYPSHQRRLMPKLAKTYALHFALMELSDRFVAHEQEDMREIETLAAGLKAYATWFTTETLQECREACGGKGYLWENRIADLKADTDIFTTFEGDNTVLTQLVAKGLLSKFKKAFNEEGNLALLRYVSNRVTTAVTQQNPFAVRNTSRVHLLSEEFHLSAFEFRENRLTASLGQRLRGHIKAGASSYEAALRCQPHMIALSEAYVERVVLQAFQKAIQQPMPATAKETLQTLYQLYALHTIESHKGWYLESDYMLGVKTKAIRQEVDRLCAETRTWAKVCVDAFAIPEPLLGAAILQRRVKS
ncbi:MAG: acyl-CoA dehydrogenase [Phaeodactylibacter sp.]|uniref:acyl-CoA dehydrogenase family protein n=1 Tax=Phaeodactylibacter sp. TaxID=1940289 RepID=UPI0032EBC064